MSPRDMPPLPDTVPTVLGDLAVSVVGFIAEDGRRGEFSEAHRTVAVYSDLAPVVQWQTLFHECTHAALFDSAAAELLTDKQTEAVCNAVGTWLAHAVLTGRLTLA